MKNEKNNENENMK